MAADSLADVAAATVVVIQAERDGQITQRSEPHTAKKDIHFPSLVPWVTPWFSSAMSGVPGLGVAAICALGGIHEDWFRLGANGGQLWCGR